MTDDLSRPTDTRTPGTAEEQPATPVAVRTGSRINDVALEPRPPSFLGRLREYALVAAIAITLAFLVKTFLVQPFWIPSESMESGLIKGDRIIVNKVPSSGRDIQRGDVVVFSDPDGWLGPQAAQSTGPLAPVKKGLQFVGLYPAGDQHLVKRVIGMPGDKVECCDSRGRLKVNGVPIDEVYLKEGEQPSLQKFEITVPEGRIWVMGDNRGHSADSRAHDDGNGGTGSVPTDKVTGKVVAIVWPAGRIGGVDAAHDVFAKVPSP